MAKHIRYTPQPVHVNEKQARTIGAWFDYEADGVVLRYTTDNLDRPECPVSSARFYATLREHKGDMRETCDALLSEELGGSVHDDPKPEPEPEPEPEAEAEEAEVAPEDRNPVVTGALSRGPKG